MNPIQAHEFLCSVREQEILYIEAAKACGLSYATIQRLSSYPPTKIKYLRPATAVKLAKLQEVLK